MNGKQLKVARIIEEILGFLTSAVLGFGCVLLIERLLSPDSEWYWYSADCWPLLLCHICGRIATGKSKGKVNLLRIGSLVISLAAIYALDRNTEIIGYIILALTVIPGIMLFQLGMVCVPVYPQYFAIGSFVLYLGQTVFYAVVLDYRAGLTPLSIGAMAAFLLYLFSANVNSLYSGLHAMDGKTPLPTGVRLRNTALLGGFTIVSVVIAATGILRKVVVWLFETVRYLAVLLIEFIKSLFHPMDVEIPADEIERDLTPAPLDDIPESKFLKYFVIGVVVAVMLAALILLIIAIIRSVHSHGGKPRKKRVRRIYAENGTTDEEESTFDLDQLLARGRNGLRTFGERFRRKPGFDDMPDAKAKMRFVYRKLLNSPASGERATAATPIELGRKLATPKSPGVLTFTDDYSAMKYGDREPDATQTENARKVLRELSKLEKTAARQA